MASADKDESSRNLLDKIEGDWDSPPPPRTAATPEVQAALDAAAARLVDSLDPPPVSVPTMDELDSGWDEEDEDDEEEEDEEEPELPDERLDPVAYKLAKEARDERIEARRVKRRAKAEAKKARRKARLEAQRSKQKGKQKRARPAPKPARPSKEERNRARKAAASSTTRARVTNDDDDDTGNDDGTDADEDELQPSSLPSRAKAKLPPSRPMTGSKPMLSKTNQWMLAVAVVIFLAAAIFAAVVAR
jgi:hypothetical protein